MRSSGELCFATWVQPTLKPLFSLAVLVERAHADDGECTRIHMKVLESCRSKALNSILQKESPLSDYRRRPEKRTSKACQSYNCKKFQFTLGPANNNSCSSLYSPPPTVTGKFPGCLHRPRQTGAVRVCLQHGCPRRHTQMSQS